MRPKYATRVTTCQVHNNEHQAEFNPENGLVYVYAGHDGGVFWSCQEGSGRCHPGCWDENHYPELYLRMKEGS